MGVRFLYMLFLMILAVGGCSDTTAERQNVLRVLEIRSRALNSRDIALYSSIISATYEHKGHGVEYVKENLAQTFSRFEGISYIPAEQTITMHGDHADMEGSYRMKLVLQGKETVLNGTERIKLAKEAGGWKIIAGL